MTTKFKATEGTNLNVVKTFNKRTLFYHLPLEIIVQIALCIRQVEDYISFSLCSKRLYHLLFSNDKSCSKVKNDEEWTGIESKSIVMNKERVCPGESIKKRWIRRNGPYLFHLFKAYNLLQLKISLTMMDSHLSQFFPFYMKTRKEAKKFLPGPNNRLLAHIQLYKFSYYVHYHVIPQLIKNKLWMEHLDNKNTILQQTKDLESRYKYLETVIMERILKKFLTYTLPDGMSLMQVLSSAATYKAYGETYLNHLEKVLTLPCEKRSTCQQECFICLLKMRVLNLYKNEYLNI